MLALTGDIRRLFNNANMKLDAPTIKQILAALKKAPLDTQLAAQPTKPAAGAFPLALSSRVLALLLPRHLGSLYGGLSCLAAAGGGLAKTSSGGPPKMPARR